MKIAEAVQNYLESSRIREVTTPRKERKFYLSDMGKCLRMRWFKRKGIDSEFAPHVLWTFKIGDLYHDFVYQALESQGILLSAEDYVENEHFTGKFDGIVEDEGEKAVLEIKSAPLYKINRLLKGEEDPDSIAQSLSYQMLLLEKGVDIGKVIVLYVNKEPKSETPICFLEKHYHLTSWRRGKLQEEMKKLVEFWKENKVPPCSCPGWAKNYNAYEPLCRMDKKGLDKILKGLKEGEKYITTKTGLYLVKGEKREGVVVL